MVRKKRLVSRPNSSSAKRACSCKELASTAGFAPTATKPPSTTAHVPTPPVIPSSGQPASASGSQRQSRLKELRENEFKKNVRRLADVHRYLSRLDLSVVKGKSKVVEEKVNEQVLQLGTENEALRSELTAASERIKA